ncbi:exostosin family-domain-containing protein [Hyaloraphidium curvatum]|nr:exostosin family-domain-containing protein [Hyaloraphidium curvatum]
MARLRAALPPRNGSKPGWERAEDHLARVVGRIVLEWPYFNRSAGLDHFTALAHDSWYHVLRSDRVASVLPLSFRHNVLLVANQGDDGSLPMFGGSEPPGFMPSFLPLRDICVTPPSWNATEFRQKGNRTWTRAAWRDRRYLAVFRGAIDMNLTIHSGGVRQALYGMLKGDRDILFGRTNPFHARELLDSKFCLFIRGFNVWSERMGTLVNAGCIPVIVADRYVLPFWQTIDWREISVRIPERDALVPGRLKGILRGIPEGRAMAMEARLAEVSRNLTWYLPPRPGDAMDQVLAILGSKTPRLRPVPNAFWDGPPATSSVLENQLPFPSTTLGPRFARHRHRSRCRIATMSVAPSELRGLGFRVRKAVQGGYQVKKDASGKPDPVFQLETGTIFSGPDPEEMDVDEPAEVETAEVPRTGSVFFSGAPIASEQSVPGFTTVAFGAGASQQELQGMQGQQDPKQRKLSEFFAPKAK